MQLRQQTKRVINTNRRNPKPAPAPVVITPVEEDKRDVVEEILEPTPDTQRKNKPFKVGFNKNEKNKTSDN